VLAALPARPWWSVIVISLGVLGVLGVLVLWAPVVLGDEATSL
jgi:hypothetical protein